MKTLLTSASLSCVFLLLSPGLAVHPSALGNVFLPMAHADGIDADGDEEDLNLDDEDDEDDEEEEFNHRPISCTKAQKVVERAGFTNVGVRSCTGKTFRFTGSRSGYNLEIVVSRLGRILHTRRR